MTHPLTHRISATIRRATGTRLPAAILLLATPVVVAGCSTGSSAQVVVADKAIPIRVTKLAGSGGAAASDIRLTGVLAGKQEVALSFKIGGVIARIAVDVGQEVRAGQVIAELRPTEIAAQVASAQEAKRKAERDLERVTKLYADSVTTLEQLQDARTGVEVAGNSLRIAQFNADYAVIRAPADGVVLSRTVEAGQVVEPGRPVLTLRLDARGMVIRIALAERDAVRTRLGDPAEVRFEALLGQVFSARITERAASATTGAGNYEAELALNDAPRSLPSGLVAQVLLRPAAVQRGAPTRVTVPLDAIVDADGDSAAVFVLRADGRTVARRQVRLTDVAEALSTAQVPVLAGLDGSETLVTTGMSRLVDGATVRVVTTAGQQAMSDASPTWKVKP